MKQLEFKKVRGWGGKRRGAGRKSSGLVSHARRASVNIKRPLHLTLKLKPRVAHLRQRTLLKEFRKAVGSLREFGLFVNQYSLQGDHVHMIAEAESSESLGRGMKSLGSRFGKAIRRFIGGRGEVFAGRFHMEIIKNPTQMKNALKYVLLNFSKHTKLIEYIDEFSSGYAFKEWRLLLGRKINPLLADCIAESWRFKHPELCDARSWLGREGWKRAA